MRLPARTAFIAALSLSLASCTMSFPLDILLRDGRVVFAPEREWKWFIIPHRPPAVLCDIKVYDRTGYAWWLRMAGKRCAENGIPIVYGDARPGLETVVKAKPLVPGRLYAVEVESWEYSWPHYFVAPRPGDEELREPPKGFAKVDSPEERRVQQLRAQGFPDEQIWPKIRAEADAQARMSAAAAPMPAETRASNK